MLSTNYLRNRFRRYSAGR